MSALTGTTESGDYKLPGKFLCSIGTMLIALWVFVPSPIRNRFVTRHSFYQVFNDSLETGQQGVSRRKWEVIREACQVKGKSVLDIGCAEGYFCRQAALNGASRVLGIDTRLPTLLCADTLARQDGLKVTYQMGVFPKIAANQTFDVIFCLSVLHHLVSIKDIWKVLTYKEFAADLEKLRGHLKFLRSKTNPGGTCVIEMPYEYEDPAEKNNVDFEIFSQELLKAGFAAARQHGSWEYNKEHEAKKDRIIYAAIAG